MSSSVAPPSFPGPDLRPDPRPNPRAGAARGLQWWTDAIAWLFVDAARVGVWVFMSLVFLLVTTLLHLVPVVGSITSFLLHFVFSGGMLLAARTSARGGAPAFNDLFAGFGPKAGPLLAVGLLVFLGCLALFAVVVAIGVGAALSALVDANLSSLTFPDPGAWGIGVGTLGVLLLCLLALVPLSMAAWLAPALVMLRGVPPVDALRQSLAACQRNLGALTVYGLMGIGLAFLATLLLGLGWLVLLPLVFLSTYAAYEDLCGSAADVLESAHTPPQA